MPVSNAFIPSAQRIVNDEPRFRIPVPSDAERFDWITAVDEEAEGGVAAEVRVFLDSQLSTADVMVDLAPGFGFVALSAATAAGGTPVVLVAGVTTDRLRSLQEAAIDVGSWIDEIPAASLPEMAELIESRRGADGHVFVHVDALTMPRCCQWLEPLLTAGRVLAICVGDAATSTHWREAEAALTSIDFLPCVLQQQDDDIILMPLSGAPHTSVMALPAALVRPAGTAS